MKYLWSRRYLEETFSRSSIPQQDQDADFIHNKILHIQTLFNHSSDLKIQSFQIRQHNCTMLYLETLIDKEQLERLLFSLHSTESSHHKNDTFKFDFLEKSKDRQDVIDKLLVGYSILFVSGQPQIYFINVAASFDRSTNEPMGEKVITGSHQGFIENININLNLLRKTIKNIDLCINYITLGKKTNTKIAVAYMKGIANNDLVNRVMHRLNNVSVDMGFSPGYLEELIEDSTSSPFPQMLKTERIDRVSANLIEGRIAIFSENSPTVFIVPINFFAFYQTSDDYNSRAYVGTFIRIIRIFCFWIAITFPAIYIAIIGFHFEVLPNELITTVKGSIEMIPYPPLIEALIMELAIELIREAGIRLPSPIGQTIGIVGGLVIGDAVVKAGLISNIMIVVVAITAIAAYVIPSNEMSSSVRLLRFPMMIIAAGLGFIGIVFGLMILFIHLCALESLGSPYFSPIAPFHWKDLKDAIVRLSIWKLRNRPTDIQPKETQQLSNLKGQKQK
ncbi:spore germination protein [Bacillus sp. FDAARGOS_1420]|uniref:spore germination protein n=1 Tax=unclassified Bacillus (in: firmicutes) TaxID=185979 RepID=UPI001C5BDFEC|nr:spore germination protein [Bacillus sp. FDAARGOS_1420]MBW3496507.1 spore germination protein [Bacillus sp. FDAARGOS_1420]